MTVLHLLALGCVDAPDSASDSQAQPWPEPALEEVPGVEVHGVCALELDCSQEIPDEPKVDCTLRVANEAGQVFYDGPAGAEVRGRSSSGFPKKQYGVELRTPDGADDEVDLLGMGAEADWVLNGAWIDRALVRNKLAYDVFQAFDPEGYGPESRACTLDLNGAPWGVYFLVERLKAAPSRVDVQSEQGWVIKLNDQGSFPLRESVGHGAWKVVSPGAPSAAQLAGVEAWVADWQDAVLHDPAALFTDHVDRGSAIDFVILQELFKNNDGYYLSVHLTRDQGLARFAPWDLDLTLGQPTYNDNVVPTGWVAYRPPWVANMAGAPGFSDALAERWRDLRTGELADDALLTRVEGQWATLGPDRIEENFEIWDWDDIDFLGGYLPPVDDFEHEADNIRAWIPARTAWIDDHIDGW
jgi:hypothetical protein